MELKIADFGLATEFRNGSPVFSNVCGTPNYLSPEMLLKQNYSYEVDVWSLGVAL
jgi:serine/threonine protein kinase